MLARPKGKARADVHIGFVAYLTRINGHETDKGRWDYQFPYEQVCCTGGVGSQRQKYFTCRTELNKYEPVVVAAGAGIQPTGTYRLQLTRDTYDMKPKLDRFSPPWTKV